VYNYTYYKKTLSLLQVDEICAINVVNNSINSIINYNRTCCQSAVFNQRSIVFGQCFAEFKLFNEDASRNA